MLPLQYVITVNPGCFPIVKCRIYTHVTSKWYECHTSNSLWVNLIQYIQLSVRYPVAAFPITITRKDFVLVFYGLQHGKESQ